MSSIERRRGRNGALVRQRFVNLNPPACLPCQGGNPCPRRTAEPGGGRGRGGAGQKGYGARKSGVGVASWAWGRDDAAWHAARAVRHVTCATPSHSCATRRIFAPPCARAPLRQEKALRSGKNWSSQVAAAVEGAFERKGAGVTVEGPDDRAQAGPPPFSLSAIGDRIPCPDQECFWACRSSPGRYTVQLVVALGPDRLDAYAFQEEELS